MQKSTKLEIGQTVLSLHTHTHTHGFTVQGQDASREGSAYGASCPEAETPQRGQASVSTPLQSGTCSLSLEKAPPTAALAATPASEQTSFSLGLSSGAGATRDGTSSAGTLADDVFSAPDSPHKEFHCAVLRALSKEPSVGEAAKADQAPGTPDQAESCLNSGLLLASSPAQSWSTSQHAAALGVWASPACCVLSFFVGFGVCCHFFFFYICKRPPYPQFNLLKPLLDYFSPRSLFLMSCPKVSELWQIRYLSAV